MSVSPEPCTTEEYLAARAARTSLIDGARAVRITIDGDLTEYTQVSLPQLNETIAGMQLYLEADSSIESCIASGFRVSGTKGF